MVVNNMQLRPYTKWRTQNQESYIPQINDFEWKILSETYENDHWGHYFSKDNEKEFEDNYSPLQIINHQIITK